MSDHKTVSFVLNGVSFEYDTDKNAQNIQKHGISFRNAARVFFDYDRIEFFDDDNSLHEERYDTIGDTSAGHLLEQRDGMTVIGNIDRFANDVDDILYVVYTERVKTDTNGTHVEVTRLISARLATNFERGLYYGKQE